MAEESRTGANGKERPVWTLRLAGPQDDSNKSLWARHARATGYGPAELVGMVSRSRWLAAVMFAAVFLPAAAWIWTIKPTYEAAASVMVRPDSGALTPAQVMAEVESLHSLPVLARVAETLGMTQSHSGSSQPERAEQAAREMQTNLRVGSLPQSGVITIQYASKDPKLAAGVVNTLASLYVDRHASRRRAAEALAAGDDALEAYERELQRARTELADFQQRNQSALLTTQKDAAETRSSQLTASLRRLDAQLLDAEKSLDALKSRGQGGASSAAQVGQAQTQVDNLRNRRSEVLEQLRGAEGWRSQLERLSVRHGELKAAVEAAEQNYILYQRPQDEEPAAAKNAAGPALNASLMRRAEEPAAPANGDQQPWLLLFSALAAACAALGAAVLFEPSRRPVSYVADIATSVGAPVLMMIEEN